MKLASQMDLQLGCVEYVYTFRRASIRNICWTLVVGGNYIYFIDLGNAGNKVATALFTSPMAVGSRTTFMTKLGKSL